MTTVHATLELAPARVEVEHRPNGELILRSPRMLGDYPRCIGEHLERWAAVAPRRVFLAERNASGTWRRLTYGEALHSSGRIAAALLAHGLSPSRPLAIL